MRFLPLFPVCSLLICTVPAVALAQAAVPPVLPMLPVPAAPLAKPVFPNGIVALETSMDAVFAGRPFPTAINLKDLDPSWARVTVSITAPTASTTLAMMTGNSTGGDAFYTRGDVAIINGERYLMGYRLQVKLPSIFEMSMAAAQGRKQNMQKVTGNTSMMLSLLNMRQIAAFGEMRPYKLEQEILDATPVLPGQDAPGPAGDGQAQASMNNLKQLGLAVVQYAQDHGQKLPSIPDSATARKSLAGYLGDEAVLKQPGNGQPYVPNDKLSGARLDKIDRPAEVVLFYEAAAAGDGFRSVLFADGQVKRIKDADFGGLRLEPVAGPDHP